MSRIKVKQTFELQNFSSWQTSIWMRKFSYCELIQHFCVFKFGTFFHWGLVSHQFSYFKDHSNYRYHIGSAISRTTQIIDKNTNWTQLCLLESLYMKSRPQCRLQSHQRTKSFQIGPIVLLFIFSALLIVYVALTTLYCLLTSSCLFFPINLYPDRIFVHVWWWVWNRFEIYHTPGFTIVVWFKF